MDTNLRCKKVLITSGPTWVPLDKVRVISNTATGETGSLLAKRFTQLGCKVTLLLGPTGTVYLDRKIRLKRFSFFNELDVLLRKELQKDYDIVIQAAAISDFAPESSNNKISSQCKKIKLTLKPTIKLINYLRKYRRNAFLVGFKFEPNLTANKLLVKARNLIKSADLDLVVGNSLLSKRYSAYLISKIFSKGPFLSKLSMVNGLIKLIRRTYARN